MRNTSSPPVQSLAPEPTAPAADPYKGYVDRSFDPVFAALPLTWYPWIGINFAGTPRRTIILGESVYLYKTKHETPEETLARIQRSDSLRLRHLSHGIEANYDSRFVRNFERAVFQKKRPDQADREKLWGDVIYHNLVPELLRMLSHRPTDVHYRDGWVGLLQLAEAVGATRCIVYGHEQKKISALRETLEDASLGKLMEVKKLPAIGKAVPRSAIIRLPGRQLEMLFIGHPSRFFSWRHWGKLMQERGMSLAE